MSKKSENTIIIHKREILTPMVYRGQVQSHYFLDQNGIPYSTKRGTLKTLTIHPGSKWNPYPSVHLTINGAKKTILLHRLVCETFHKKPLPNVLTKSEWKAIPSDIKAKLLEHISHADRYQVNHIDHNPNNFHPSNLEWVTASENQQKYQQHKKCA